MNGGAVLGGTTVYLSSIIYSASLIQAIVFLLLFCCSPRTIEHFMTLRLREMTTPQTWFKIELMQ